MTEGPTRPAADVTPQGHGRAVLLALRSGKIALAVVSLLVLAVTGYSWQFYTSLNSGLSRTDVFDRDPKAKPLDGAIDILLVGMDSRTDAQGNPLPEEVLAKLHLGEASGEKQTDTMILVHIPQDGESAIAISFPRDSYVRIAGGYGKHKLNSAYVYAYNEKFQQLYDNSGKANLDKIDRKAKVAGRKNLITTIERFIGRPGMIDRYAEVNLSSFYHITKALGGIKVCLNNPVHEPKSGVDLPAGVQTISGLQALAFVRQRYGLEDGGLDRIRRQQAFLSGVANKILSADVLLNPAKLTELISAVQKSVILSEGWDLQEFAAQMRALSGGNIKFYTVPTEGIATIGGASVLRVDAQRVRSFVDTLVGEPPQQGSASRVGNAEQALPAAKSIAVDIYNGSGADSLGKQVRDKLRGVGFQGNSYATIGYRTKTTIRYPPGERHNVDVLTKALGIDALIQPDSDVPSGHLRLLLGDGYQQASDDETDQAGSRSSSSPPPSNTATPSSDTAPPSKGPLPGRDPITAGGVPCVD